MSFSFSLSLDDHLAFDMVVLANPFLDGLWDIGNQPIDQGREHDDNVLEEGATTISPMPSDY